MKLQITAAAALLLLSVSIGDAEVFDVMKYGAKADGATCISQALMSAWKEACASTTPSKILIPRGTYALGAITFQGPCKAPLEFQLQGTVKAPAESAQFKEESWVTFQYLDHLTLSGGGVFDGQGKIAWSQNDCHKNKNCRKIINLRFNFVTNALVQDITTLDSKNFHVNVLGCKNFTFNRFTVTAPGNSPNTDGIHIAKVDGINITDSSIGTGDDCISIGDGSKNIRVTRVNCGPGHGISVGSLGRNKGEESVQGLWVKNCTLTDTQNGVRIKTWPASFPGSVSDMHFEDIKMVNVGNPILIDQLYCPWNQCKADIPSLVKIRNVTFKNIHGTSSTAVAVKLTCSSKVPCENVVVGNVRLTYTGPEAPAATSQCSNVAPSFLGTQTPSVCAKAA
ncbi:exopolygalacturonase-like [Punica granatum]|nr:exopolygalacturonase-like [Punica granatum]